MPAAPVLIGAGLIAAATVAGAWLAGRRSGHREIWLASASGALLAIAGLHLLPDAWADAGAAGLWLPLIPLAAVGAFSAAGLAARAGCRCREDSEQFSGAGAAAALALHRFLEGSAVALAGSAVVAVALAVHAFAEGLATGTLLGGKPRRMAGWLAVMCLSPLVGAVTVSTFRVPEMAGPLLPAVAAGVVAQAAWVSLRVGVRGLRTRRLPIARPAVAVTTAAVITALAVHTAG
jgi:zinc transporter ZupT